MREPTMRERTPVPSPTRVRERTTTRARAARPVAGRRTLLAGALALGLVAGGGIAWSYWATSGTSAGQDVTSGSLNLQAGPVTGSETLPGIGGNWGWTGLSLAAAWPGESVAGQVVIASTGTVGLTVTGTIRSGTNALSPYLLASATLGGTAANATTGGVRTGTCTGGTPVATGIVVSTTPVAFLPETALAAGATITLCVVLQLSPTAPPTLQGAQAPIVSIALAAEQEPDS